MWVREASKNLWRRIRHLWSNDRERLLKELQEQDDAEDQAIEEALTTRPLTSVDTGLDLMRDQLSRQMASVDAIDAKAGFYVASSSILLAILIAWKQLVQSPHALFWLPLIALLPYAVGVTLATIAYGLEVYVDVPDPMALEAQYLDLDPREMRYRILRAMMHAAETNNRKLKRKTKFVSWAYIAMAVQVVFAIALFVIELWP